MLAAKLKMIHLQLTARCNLNCTFCGQWGKNGFMKKNPPSEDLDFAVWKKAIDSIVKACPEELPKATIWGGEPLLHKDFDKLAEYMSKAGFELGIVTNGTMLGEHAGAVNKFVKTLYISIDGPPETHDKLRGKPGLFEEIKKNMALIDDNVSKVAMSFFAESNYKSLPQLPFALADMNVDMLLLQNLIFSTPSDIACYKNWLKTSFNQSGSHADSWAVEKFGDYINELPGVLKEIQDNIAAGVYPMKVDVQPREITPENIKDWYMAENGLANAPREHDHCYAPFLHLHIKPQGDVHYCVDFDDFKAGNILEDDVMDIFHNEISKRFRKEIKDGKNPLCKRCPWRFNTAYKFD